MSPRHEDTLPAVPPIAATALDLPHPVARALAEPATPREFRVEAADIPFAVREWGEPDAPSLLLVHGVTSSSATWWRVGPALAAAGFRVVAPDLPGHGQTGVWTGHVRFRDNAADLVAFVRAIGIDTPTLSVVGHSWGAMTVAALPGAGIRPRVLVLLDPPALSRDQLEAMTLQPEEQRYDDQERAIRIIGEANPTWSYGDVVAKAEALVRFDADAVRAVLLDNGDWDGGLADLTDPAANGVSIWIVRGDEDAGGYLPVAALPPLAARVGADRIVTIAGGPHSPQRTHPEATLVALLRALQAE